MDKFINTTKAGKWFKFIEISDVSQIIEESDKIINQTNISNLLNKEFTEDLDILGFPIEYKVTIETSHDIHRMLLLISLKSKRICLFKTDSQSHEIYVNDGIRESLNASITKIKDILSIYSSEMKITESMIEVITNSDTTLDWKVFLFAVLKFTFRKQQIPADSDVQFTHNEKLSLCYEMMQFLLSHRVQPVMCTDTEDMISLNEQQTQNNTKYESSNYVTNINNNDNNSNPQTTPTATSLRVLDKNNQASFSVHTSSSSLFNNYNNQNPHLSCLVIHTDAACNPCTSGNEIINNLNFVHTISIPNNSDICNSIVPIDCTPNTTNMTNARNANNTTARATAFNTILIESSPITNSHICKTSPTTTATTAATTTSKLISVEDVQYLLSKRPDLNTKIRNIIYSKQLTQIEKKTAMKQIMQLLKEGCSSPALCI